MQIEVTLDEFSEEFQCNCGNTVMGSGFFPCNKQGDIIEPLKDSDWDLLYICPDCGRIYHINQYLMEVEEMEFIKNGELDDKKIIYALRKAADNYENGELIEVRDILLEIINAIDDFEK